MNYGKIVMILVALLATVPCFAIDYWTIGKVQAVLEGGVYDLTGRRITAPQAGQLYIKNDKKIIK